MARRGTPPYFYLRPDEQVVARIPPEKEWALASFVSAFLVLTTIEAVAVAALRRVEGEPDWLLPTVFGVYGFLLVVSGLVAWRRYATTEYALTDARIYARHGRLITQVHFTTHDRITDIRYRQGPLERIFGISRIVFATAGGDVQVVGVRDAIAVKEEAESARERFIQRLLERAGLDEQTRQERRAATAAAAAPPASPHAAPLTEPHEEGAAPARVPPAPLPAPVLTGPRPDYLKRGDVPLWFGKPRAIAAVSSILPLLGLLPFLIVSSMSGGGGLVATPLLVVAALVMIGFRVLALRRMEYTVTDKRVYTRSGVFGTTVTQLTYDKITDITYRQDLLGRIFGFGALTVNTAGSNAAPAAMIGLRDPLEVKSLIEATRSRYLHEEEEEHP